MRTLRPVFLSSYPPEQCGLATFTKDSADSVDAAAGRPISSVIAIEKTLSLTNANGRVAHVIDNNQRESYRKAASVVNAGTWDVVNVQHEFGLYPGVFGARRSCNSFNTAKSLLSARFIRFRQTLILHPIV